MLNYRNALAVTGRGKIIRRFPMVCGLDLSGRVIATQSPAFAIGDEVVVVGQGSGETHWRGYSQRARVRADAALKLPAGMNLKQAMAIGTAGFTAMLALLALEDQRKSVGSKDPTLKMDGIAAGDREIVVTGAAGGVGSIAVALLAAHGYKVAASTGRTETHAYLRELGATTIVDRADLARESPPLAPQRWAGGIDAVGGQTLASVIASTAIMVPLPHAVSRAAPN